jgi:hypothetical protein
VEPDDGVRRPRGHPLVISAHYAKTLDTWAANLESKKDKDSLEQEYVASLAGALKWAFRERPHPGR